MLMWITLGVVLAVLTGVVTLIWWKVGDQWADEEYKRFGHGGGAPRGPAPTVITGFDTHKPTSPEPGSGADPKRSDMD